MGENSISDAEYGSKQENYRQKPIRPVLRVLKPTNTWQFTFLWDKWYWHTHWLKHTLSKEVSDSLTSQHFEAPSID